VQGGARLGDIDHETHLFGLAVPTGIISRTGIGGLTLGGGLGWLIRKYGMTIDNVLSFQVVTANGEVVTASASQNPDLFWALRGGGGNFGVVTRFTFRLHEVGPTITGGLLLWDAGEADQVLATFRELTESAPRELTAAAAVLTAPPAPFVPVEWHGRPVVGMIVCHSGADPVTDLAPIRALADPIVDLVGPQPYAAQQSMMDAIDPRGLHQYWKAEFLPGLTGEYLDVFRETSLDATSPLSYSVIFHIGGALNERDADDGAVGNRDARFISGFSGVWPPDDPRSGEHMAWVRGSWERIRPFSTGGNYVNFQLTEDDASRTMAAYGSNYERLRSVKARYDPENLFRVNRNIPPAA
jgi:FAD/FMN-containing dehydrogenase